MSSIVTCPRCQALLRVDDADADAITQCPACGHRFASGGAGDVIDVTAETPEGEVVGRPAAAEEPPEWPGRGRGRGYTIRIDRRVVSGPGCCGPGCLLFALLFLWLLLGGC